MEVKMMGFRPGVFSELSIRNGMREWVESRQDVCHDPRTYDELPQEVKATLDAWIASSITLGKKERSSYGLKTYFHRSSGVYIYTGVFNGAMLKAGYQPVNPKDLINWHFKVNVLKETGSRASPTPPGCLVRMKKKLG